MEGEKIGPRPGQQESELRASFESLGSDQSNCISLSLFKKYLKTLGLNPKRRDIAEIISRAAQQHHDSMEQDQQTPISSQSPLSSASIGSSLSSVSSGNGHGNCESAANSKRATLHGKTICFREFLDIMTGPDNVVKKAITGRLTS